MDKQSQLETALSDQAQRTQALDITQSYIVQAPAGSGKTELLTQRYLALLAHAKDPEEIIAITFTRKAAAEMRCRILEALQSAVTSPAPQAAYALSRWQLAQAVLKQNTKLNWNILENPNRLRIQTIDSFSASITRQMPILAGFGAQPAILETPYPIYQEAARAILAGLESFAPWTDALARLLLHLDNDYRKVESLLSDMLAKRDQWLQYVVEQNPDHNLREILEQGLQQTIIDDLFKLHDSLPSEFIDQLISIGNYAAQNLKKLNSSSAICHLAGFAINRDLQQNIEQLEHEKNCWLGFAELLLTQEGEWRKTITKREGFISPADASNSEEKKFLQQLKNSAQELLNSLAEYPQFKQNLHAIRILPPCNYSEKQWEILTALVELLPILVAQLQILFQENEAVDYVEVAHCALRALGDAQEPTDLALRLDYQIQHLLVDEFQDTSITQFRLLEQLTAGWHPGDNRTLFLVGDPMQSIYRFRKAEVGLFLQAWQRGLGQVALTPLNLSINFRSTALLVNWFNEIFQSLMPEQIDIGTGAVPFCPSAANSTDCTQSQIAIHGVLAEQDQSEAELISRFIQQQRQENPQQRIAILVRARSHLLEILPALQQQKIAYQAIEIDPLAQRTVIQDLLALTRALLHLDDRIAWLAILRAPWCGLTLQELEELISPDPNAIIWQQLNPFPDIGLSATSKKNLQHMLTVLKQSFKNRQRQTLSSTIQGTWLALGGPASLQHENDLEDAKVFFKLLNSLEQAGDLSDIELLTDKLMTLYATPPLTTDNYIEIMTIHKAKGLEFDTVFLPGLDRLLTTDDPQLLLCMDRPSSLGTTHLLLAPIKASAEEEDAIYNYLRHEEKTRASYETMRLLYVAATRAKHRLILSATMTEEFLTGNKTPAKNSLLAHLWPSLGSQFLENLEQNSQYQSNSASNTINNLHRRFALDWQPPTLPSPVFIERTDIPTPIENISATKRHIGTIVHQLLQQISLDGLENWNEDTLQNRSQAIKILLLRHGIFSTELENSLVKVQTAIRQILQDPRGRWILTNHSQAQAEFALTTFDQEIVKQIVIDRTFLDDQGIRWIIDYKTTESDGKSQEEFLQQAIEQHRPQLEQYAKIIQQLDPNHKIHLGLYFPLIPTWHEWEYK